MTLERTLDIRRWASLARSLSRLERRSPRRSASTMAPNQPVGPAGADGGFQQSITGRGQRPRSALPACQRHELPHNMTPPTFEYPPSSTRRPGCLRRRQPARRAPRRRRPTSPGVRRRRGDHGHAAAGAPNLADTSRTRASARCSIERPTAPALPSTALNLEGIFGGGKPQRRPQVQPCPERPRRRHDPLSYPGEAGTSTRKGRTWSRRLTARRKAWRQAPGSQRGAGAHSQAELFTGEPMSYTIADFSPRSALNAQIHHAYPNVAAELEGDLRPALSKATPARTIRRSRPRRRHRGS